MLHKIVSEETELGFNFTFCSMNFAFLSSSVLTDKHHFLKKQTKTLKQKVMLGLVKEAGEEEHKIPRHPLWT